MNAPGTSSRASRSPRVMPSGRARFLPGVLALGYIALVLGSGLDRASQDNAGLAALIPAPFANVALDTRARAAMVAQQPAKALSDSRAAVARAPMEASNTTLLGVSASMAGKADLADAAFQLSARQGWDEPVTQSYMIQKALAVRNYAQAVMRLDAILRGKPALHANAGLMLPIEANFDAQADLVDLLAHRPPWLGTYASDIAGLPSEHLGIRAGILADLADHGTRLGCDGIDAMTGELTRRQSAEDAHTLWQMHCPQSDSNLVRDGHFVDITDVPTGNSDFRWKQVSSGDLSVGRHPAPHGPGQMLDVTNRGEFPTPFVHQLLVLNPGTYRLRWHATGEDGKPSTAVSPKVSCGEAGPVTIDPAGISSADVSVPTGCVPIWLEFQITPQEQPVIFGDVLLGVAR